MLNIFNILMKNHNYIAKVDIGLVPQLIPQNNNFFQIYYP